MDIEKKMIRKFIKDLEIIRFSVHGDEDFDDVIEEHIAKWRDKTAQ